MLVQLYIIAIYISLLLSAVYLAMKYSKAETIHRRKEAVNVRSAATRLYLMAKLSTLILKKPFTAIILLTLGLSTAAAAYSASSTSSITDVTKTFGGVGEGNAYLVELSQPSSVDPRNVSAFLCGGLSSYCEVVPFLRISLSEPLRTNLSKTPLYVLIGIQRRYYEGLTGFRTAMYSAPPYEGVMAVKLSGAGKVNVIKVRLVNESFVKSLKIYGSLPILPVEGFIGSEPVTPPPKYVLIGPLDEVRELLGAGNQVSDVLVVVKDRQLEIKNLVTGFEAMRKAYPVKDVWIFREGHVLLLTDAQVPTPSSIIASLITAGIAVLLSISLFNAAVPYLKRIYWHLILEGFPPWAMSVVMLFYVSVTVWGVGAGVISWSFSSLGSVSAFNSLITTAVSWGFLAIYSGKALKPLTLKTDVYIPPTERYTLLTTIKDPTRLKHLIRASLEGNEFFDLEGFEHAVVGEEVVIHARLTYKESWGSGLDVSVVLTPEKEATLVTLTAITWGIEEVSEAVTRNMLGLALSRIVGVIKSWELMPQ